MSPAEKQKLLRDAPNIVAKAIQDGLISHGSSEPRKVRPERREEYFDKLDPAQRKVAESFESSRPHPKQYPDTTRGYSLYRFAYKEWHRKRAAAVAKVGGAK